MNGWLPEDFQENKMAERAGAAVLAVRGKVVRRRKILRATQFGGAAAAVLVLAFVLSPKLNRQESASPFPTPIASKAVTPSPVPELPAPAPQAPVVPQSQIPNPKSQILAPQIPNLPAQIEIAKSGSGVQLAWEGDPNAQYVVYRCTTPRFDTCAVAGEVRGTRWSDRESNTAPLVFYKVEPRT